VHFFVSLSHILPDYEHRGLAHFFVVVLNRYPYLQISHSFAFATEQSKQFYAAHCTHKELFDTVKGEHEQSPFADVHVRELF
jgi:hypothetical protein